MHESLWAGPRRALVMGASGNVGAAVTRHLVARHAPHRRRRGRVRPPRFGLPRAPVYVAGVLAGAANRWLDHDEDVVTL
jgi:uncharacterized protein YbjT (DUF2867 family)